MGDKNPIRTLGDYSKPSHEGYRNTIELIERNNVVPLRSDTIRDFAKPVKAISFPQNLLSTFDCRLIELKNQVQCLMKAHLAPKQPVQVNKITSPCEICSGPHDTQYYMENLEQAFVEYASSRTDEAGGKCDTVKNPKLSGYSTAPVFSALSYPTEDPQCSTRIYSSINSITICPKQPDESLNNKPEEEREETNNPENINTNPSSPPDPSVSFITEKVCQLNSFFESLCLVP
nr:MAK10-like protein [Tanacetum cinerariifolium]